MELGNLVRSSMRLAVVDSVWDLVCNSTNHSVQEQVENLIEMPLWPLVWDEVGGVIWSAIEDER